MHDCDIQIPFHKYESLFIILIYIIKFVVATQYAYGLNVFAKIYRETSENCDYKAIPNSVRCRHEIADRHPNYFELKSQELPPLTAQPGRDQDPK